MEQIQSNNLTVLKAHLNHYLDLLEMPKSQRLVVYILKYKLLIFLWESTIVLSSIFYESIFFSNHVFISSFLLGYLLIMLGFYTYLTIEENLALSDTGLEQNIKRITTKIKLES